MPQLSVLIPAFNEEKYISETINSVRSQSFADIEILIGDNASTDETWKVVQELAKSDSRIKCFKRDSNIGSTDNMRLLVKDCSSSFISIIGAHDLVHPRWAESLLTELVNDSDLSLAYSSVQWIDFAGNTLRVSDGGDFEDLTINSFKRLLRCIEHEWGECTAVNGIFRGDVLKSFWFPKCRGPDHVLLARASFLGKIKRVNSRLYLRREIDRNSGYHERIRGSNMIFLTQRIEGLVASHVVDTILIYSYSIISVKKLFSLSLSLAKGYKPLGFHLGIKSFLRTVFWIFYLMAMNLNQ